MSQERLLLGAESLSQESSSLSSPSAHDLEQRDADKKIPLGSVVKCYCGSPTRCRALRGLDTCQLDPSLQCTPLSTPHHAHALNICYCSIQRDRADVAAVAHISSEGRLQATAGSTWSRLICDHGGADLQEAHYTLLFALLLTERRHALSNPRMPWARSVSASLTRSVWRLVGVSRRDGCSTAATAPAPLTTRSGPPSSRPAGKRARRRSQSGCHSPPRAGPFPRRSGGALLRRR